MGERHGRAQALEDAAKVAENNLSMLQGDCFEAECNERLLKSAKEIRSLKETE